MITIASNDPLFNDMPRAKVEVVRVNEGPEKSTPMVHGMWHDLLAETTRRLSRDIRRQLLHGP